MLFKLYTSTKELSLNNVGRKDIINRQHPIYKWHSASLYFLHTPDNLVLYFYAGHRIWLFRSTLPEYVMLLVVSLTIANSGIVLLLEQELSIVTAVNIILHFFLVFYWSLQAYKYSLTCLHLLPANPRQKYSP